MNRERLPFRAAGIFVCNRARKLNPGEPEPRDRSYQNSYAQVESLVAPTSHGGLKPGGSTNDGADGSTRKNPIGGAARKRPTEADDRTKNKASDGGATPKRPTPLGVRFSAAEIKTVRAKARSAGCSTNSYIRASALGSDYRPPLDPELTKALLRMYRELAAQGNNLNQIARQLNAGVVLPGQDGVLVALASSIQETLRHVRGGTGERWSGAWHMIVKSHVRGGYRAAADYLKAIGSNEKIRLVEISEPGVKDLDEAFRNMWMVGRTTRAAKPLHHVSINPMKDERLTDTQVLRICQRLEEKYGYKPGEHQRVIVEHIKDGRQHFHVIWNRVSLRTGRPVWPGHHWNKSKQAAREMEIELGLKRPAPRRQRSPRRRRHNPKHRRAKHGRYRARAITDLCKHPLRDLRLWLDEARSRRGRCRMHDYLVPARPRAGLAGYDFLRPLRAARGVTFNPPRTTTTMHDMQRSVAASLSRMLMSRPPRRQRRDDDLSGLNPPPASRKWNQSIEELIAWAWDNRRADILEQFGIYVSFGL